MGIGPNATTMSSRCTSAWRTVEERRDPYPVNHVRHHSSTVSRAVFGSTCPPDLRGRDAVEPPLGINFAFEVASMFLASLMAVARRHRPSSRFLMLAAKNPASSRHIGGNGPHDPASRRSLPFRASLTRPRTLRIDLRWLADDGDCSYSSPYNTSRDDRRGLWLAVRGSKR